MAEATTASSNVDSINYHRRIDRTPEKDFDKRPEEDKKRTALFRASVEGAIKKVTALKDELEERDQIIETERSLRKTAEARLQAHLVNMYQSPEVNEELRKRLPRANKSDPFKKQSEENEIESQSEIEEVIDLSEGSTSSHSQPKYTVNLKLEDLESQILKDKEEQATKRWHNQELLKNKTKSPEKEAKSTESKETQVSLSFMSVSSPLPGYYGHAFGTPPFAHYVGSPYSALLNSTSASSHSSPSQRIANSSMFSSSHPFLTTMHNSFLQTSPNSSSAGTSPQKGSSDTSQEKLGTNLEPSASGAAFTDSGLGASSSRFSSIFSPLRPPGPYTLPYVNPLMPDPILSCRTQFPPEASGNLDPGRQTGIPEQSRQIGILLSEIDTQKVENKKLSEKLVGSERELETLRLMMKTKELELQTQESVSAKAADLVQEVYTAQRIRDESVSGRIQVANQERDEVRLKLEAIEKKLEHGGFLEMNLDESMEDEELDREGIEQMLSHIDSPAAGDAECVNLVQHIEAIKQHRQEVTNEEMQVIMEQRDAALAKCRKLEAELMRYRGQYENSQEPTYRAKLATLQQERDLAIAKCRQLEDKIQTLCIYYSLHKSLPTEDSQREQARNAGQTYESHLKPSSSLEVEMAQKENSRLVAALRTAVIEKKQLEEDLKTVQAALNDSKEEKEKLQHLVSVLRRKLNELNNQAEKERD
ncbi:hypothetical protein CHS0354_029425 [Potamilus streckersoni]|uniref:Mirror-image polydactyly gene 1 protein n=1 Tax=Potamilus streckersoni TaxID=2493646 RepID=A0AAE0STX1_9BIVA|nr:hypothetical protein CHS0354_029425 [Potamilus streckersoni]